MNPFHVVTVNGRLKWLTRLQRVIIGMSNTNANTPLNVLGGKMNVDHCFIIAETGTFRCDECGQEYTPTYPVPITMLGAMIDAFMESHSECKERNQNESKPIDT